MKREFRCDWCRRVLPEDKKFSRHGIFEWKGPICRECAKQVVNNRSLYGKPKRYSLRSPRLGSAPVLQ